MLNAHFFLIFLAATACRRDGEVEQVASSPNDQPAQEDKASKARVFNVNSPVDTTDLIQQSGLPALMNAVGKDWDKGIAERVDQLGDLIDEMIQLKGKLKFEPANDKDAARCFTGRPKFYDTALLLQLVKASKKEKIEGKSFILEQKDGHFVLASSSSKTTLSLEWNDSSISMSAKSENGSFSRKLSFAQANEPRNITLKHSFSDKSEIETKLQLNNSSVAECRS